MERDKLISFIVIAVGLVLMAWLLGQIQGEAKEHRRNEMAAVKGRLFKIEQKQSSETKAAEN